MEMKNVLPYLKVTCSVMSTLTLRVYRCVTSTATTFLANRKSGSVSGVTSSAVRSICWLWELTGLEAVT